MTVLIFKCHIFNLFLIFKNPKMYFNFFDIIILILIFSSCLLLVGYLLLKLYQKTLIKKHLLSASSFREKQLYPAKIKAIERFTLFLERLKIENLITRINPVSESVLHYKLLINATIEQEFNYNAVQHIYISQDLYTAINKAKNLMMQQIDTHSQVADMTIKEFKEGLFNDIANINQPVFSALAFIKQELNN